MTSTRQTTLTARCQARPDPRVGGSRGKGGPAACQRKVRVDVSLRFDLPAASISQTTSVGNASGGPPGQRVSITPRRYREDYSSGAADGSTFVSAFDRSFGPDSAVGIAGSAAEGGFRPDRATTADPGHQLCCHTDILEEA